MKGFRRAQLRGSEELFRPTDDGGNRQAEIPVEVPATVHPVVPSAPPPEQRTVRLSDSEIQILADAVQHLKFPQQSGPRPSVERFEQLEDLRQKLLESL